jgi:uncharacterized membrane protein (UPF0127 family)
MKLFNGDKILISNVDVSVSFFSRLAGLLGRPEIPVDYSMYFPNCNSIHTFFMKVQIDVIMTDNNGVVLALFERLGSWRTASCLKAGGTYETKVGNIERLGIKKGDVLRLE